MGVEGGVIREGGEGIQGVLVVLGGSGVGEMGSSGRTSGSLAEVVEGVRRVGCGCVDVGSSHTHVLFEW